MKDESERSVWDEVVDLLLVGYARAAERKRYPSRSKTAGYKPARKPRRRARG